MSRHFFELKASRIQARDVPNGTSGSVSLRNALGPRNPKGPTQKGEPKRTQGKANRSGRSGLNRALSMPLLVFMVLAESLAGTQDACLLALFRGM